VSRVAFLVNGSPESAMGARAQAFASRLEKDFHLGIEYRRGNRLAAAAKFLKFLRRERPAVTYVFDMGYSGVLAATIHRATARNRMIIDTGDAITALARSMGRGPVGICLTAALERLALSAADQIVVRGTRHMEWLAKRNVPATVIPDGVEVSQFALRARSDLKARLGLADRFTVGLVGSSILSSRLGICYGWDLIEVIHLLREEKVNGLMIGDGSGIAHLKTRCEALGIADRVVFTGRIPQRDLPGYLMAMDVCLSTQTNDLPGQVRTTGKLPLYLAAGRYILASRVGEAALVLPDEMLVDYNGTVDRGYPARLAERVRGLLAHPERLRARDQGPAIAREHFDYEILARRIAGTLTSLLASSPS
jgi:glycosyltransferase involved in cell wall biosynthesis